MTSLKEFLNNLRRYGLSYYSRYYSVYQGFVVDNKDPEVLGRLKVKVPTVHGEHTLDRWAFPKGIPSGVGIGFYFIPQKNDPVWVEFLEGNSSHPIWNWGWWGKGDTPEGVRKDNSYIVMQTPDGHRIEIDEKNGEFVVKHKNGSKVSITQERIDIRHKDGKEFSVESGQVFLGSRNGQHPVSHGDTLQAELVKEKAALSALFTAIQNAPVSGGDGGATFKAGLATAISGITRGNYQNINSKTVLSE